MSMDRAVEKKRFTLKKIVQILLPAAFILIILYVVIFGDKSSRYNVDIERITVSEVYKGKFQEFIPATGEVVPVQRYSLSATEGGVITERILEAGTPVKKGDAIVRMSNMDLLLTIMNNQAQVNRAANELRSTRLSIEQNRLELKKQLIRIKFDQLQQKRSYERAQKLFEKNLISKSEFELKRDEYNFTVESRVLTIESMRQDSLFRASQIEQLELSVERMEKNLEIIEKREEALVIRAPITGMLTSLDAEIGVTKNRGETIGRIDVLDSLKVRCPIDEHYIVRIKEGKYASFEFGGKIYRLKVSKIFPEVRDGRFDVDLVFTGDMPAQIRRGQTLHIRLELGNLEEAVLLARGGFYQDTGGQWVYLLDESGLFAVKQAVTLGRQNPELFTVLEGLKPGDKVITSPYEVFGDADKLILKK